MRNGNRPMAPIRNDSGDLTDEDSYGYNTNGYFSGLTKMEYFAGLAMQGMVAKHGGLSDALIEDAIDIAASLLIALED